MRKSFFFSQLLLVFCLVPISGWALTWEFHPGIYTSCVYSDNYFGVPNSQNPTSDTTYYIGPSLDFKIARYGVELDFTGYYAWDYHKRNTQDDTEEYSLDTTLHLTGDTQLMNLDYSYLKTSQRQTLDQTWGEYSFHTGMIEYRRNFSDSNSINLRNTTEQQYAPDDAISQNSNNLFSNSSEILLELVPVQKSRLNFSGTITDYKYSSTSRDNIVTGITDASWMHDITQRLACGLEGAYTSNSPSRTPNSEIYEGFVRAEYQLTENIRIFIKAGYSWLSQETEGTTGMDSGELRIERTTDNDFFRLAGSRDYSYDYTTGSTYGMYQITAGDLYWRHTFVRSFSSTISGSIINRVPESSAQIGNTDYNAGLTLSYQPIEWATISGSYNYLETTYNNIPESYPSNTDPRTENRYSLTIEVKY